MLFRSYIRTLRAERRADEAGSRQLMGCAAMLRLHRCPLSHFHKTGFSPYLNDIFFNHKEDLTKPAESADGQDAC